MMPCHPTCARWFAVVVLALAAASCRSTGDSARDRAPILLTHPIDGDPALAEHVRMLDTRFVTTGESVEARFSLQLERGQRRSVLLHVEWFDALGASLDAGPQSWIPIEITNDAPTPMRVFAPAKAAPSFRLKFQRPDVAR